MHMRKVFLLICVSILSGVWLLCRPTPAMSEGSVSTRTRPSAAELSESIDLGARYLQQNCDINGRFVYLRHRDRYVYYGSKYNLLRHAGTMYALAGYYSCRPSQELSDLLVRAGKYLRNFIESVPRAGPGTRAVWTFPNRLGFRRPNAQPYAKLGGSGLGLVALTAVATITPGVVPLEELRGLGRFVLFMQTPEGRFYSKFYAHRGYDTEWISLYYPGEACLGLLMLHDLDPDPRWLEGAARGLGYLARMRKGFAKVPADHWALIATEKLLPKLAESAEPPVGRQDLIDHATQILAVMLAQQKARWWDPEAIGSFLGDARTTPTATRLEGILAALRFLGDDKSGLRVRLERASDLGIGFLVRNQIREGLLRGGIPRAARYLRKTKKNKPFNSRVGEVRIDYVQHALSAMMDYQAYVYGQAGVSPQDSRITD